jgi:uncharacterized protein YjiS (DUF1127 family)
VNTQISSTISAIETASHTGEQGFLMRFAHSAIARVRAWHERSVEAQELASLDDRMLADLGLTRCDIPAVVAGRYRG